MNPSKRGLNRTVTTRSTDDFAPQSEQWNGGDFNLDARFAGMILTGGTSTGKHSTNTCGAQIDNPSTRFCESRKPFLTNLKIGAAFTLPFGVQVCGTLQHFQGPPITARATSTNAQIQPSPGRPLSSAVNTNIELSEPGTIYGDGINLHLIE